MRARIIDWKGPLWTRIAVLLLPALLLGLCALTGLVSNQHLPLTGLGLYFLSMLLPVLRPREAEIVLGAGFVDIKRAGLLNQRIRGRSVKGASTAFLNQGVGLVLQHGDRPITLELREERDADAVREALGIGHHGFGKVGWTVTAVPKISVAQAMCLAVFASHVFLTLAGLPFNVDNLLWSFSAMGLMVVFSWAGAKHRAPTERVGIELELRGVVLREPSWEIPYGAIVDAREIEDRIEILTHPQFNAQPIHVCTGRHITADERTQIVAQIVAGARRARGLVPREPLVSGHVEHLARRADDARAWLLRLDATAQQMTSGAGYRGVAVDTAQLWAALEDHEADEHVRAAAARVLVRTDTESKKRIQTIAESTRDRITERRIRVVLEPDIDEAGRELDELDERRRMTAGSSRPF